MLERIIKSSTREGDVVLDAFCGCGTTVAVAHRLRRTWIGIDITYQSISLVLKRIEDTFGADVRKAIVLTGAPRDIDSAKALANKADDRVRKEFEKWAVLFYSENRAIVNDKKGADGGYDGVAYTAIDKKDTAKVLLQVKSGSVGEKDIRDLLGTMKLEDAVMGIFLTLEPPTKAMTLKANAAGVFKHPLMGKDFPVLRIVTIQDVIEKNVRLDLPLPLDVLKKAQSASADQQKELF